MKNQNIAKSYIITWWPCGGKSSIIPALVEVLIARNKDVYVIPEIATLLESEWIHPKYGTDIIDFQKQIAKRQIELETQAQEKIEQTWNFESSIILCDRSLIDNLSYVSKEEYIPIIEEFETTLAEVLNNRYYGAISLQSAAYGAEQFYTTANNDARTETLEEARIREDNIINTYKDFWWKRFFVWNTNPSTQENYTFEEKKKRAEFAFLSMLGEPPIEFERQFEIYEFDKNILQSYSPKVINVEQYYLPLELFNRPDFDEARIRKIEKDEFVYYFLTLKKRQDNQRIEEEKEISFEMYAEYYWKKLSDKNGIFKKRHLFINPHDWHRYEFDIFTDEVWTEINKYRLEVELPNNEFDIVMPDFILDYKETTGDASFSNFNIASKK